jgi:iron complex outermembrane receptor protein
MKCARIATGSILAAGLLLLHAELGRADSTEPADSPAASEMPALDVITVTARRRSENIENVPASITAIDARQLAEQNVVTETDLQAAVPGLTVRETQGSNSLTFSIRGQTVDAFTGSQTAVVPYFDEVEHTTGGASTFFDLESIQVLKGPQGTLFGRNSTGGAILYTSAAPKDQFEGSGTLRFGNYGMREGVGVLNLPLSSDTVLLRIAGDAIYRDGYQTNIYNGSDLGEVERLSARMSLLVRPTDDLKNLLVMQFDRIGGNSTANRLFTVNQCGTSHGGFALNCDADLFYSPNVDSVVGPGVWEAYIAAHPKVNPAGILAYLENDSPKLGFWQADEVSPITHSEHDYFVINTTTYDIDADTLIKNITGASYDDDHDLASTIGSPYLIFASFNPVTGQSGNQNYQTNLSDELQLQGRTLDQMLTYTLGAYYQYSNTNSLYPQVYFNLSPLDPGSVADDHFRIRDSSTALFSQGTYDLSSFGLKGLSFTGGVRYAWEQLNMTQLAGAVFPEGTYESTRFSNPSWTLGLAWQATEDLLLYAEGRRSWRSGGFNGTAPPIEAPASGGGNLFGSEIVHDVEIGAKLAGDIANRPARLNIALYNQWIDHVQREVNVTPPGRQQAISVTVNVDEAEVSGIELDGSIKPAQWLETGVAATATSARYTKNEVGIFGQTFLFGPYADTPKFSGSLYAKVVLPSPSAWGAMDVRADLYAQTYTYFSNNNDTITPDTRIPGYGLINMRYEWNGVFRSKFSLAAFVKNLADREYYTGGFALTASLGVNGVSVGQPRMFGGEFTYAF